MSKVKMRWHLYGREQKHSFTQILTTNKIKKKINSAELPKEEDENRGQSEKNSLLIFLNCCE